MSKVSSWSVVITMAGVVLASFLALLGCAVASPDPCKTYHELKDDRRSTAYRVGPGEKGLCDLELIPRWYRFTSRAGGAMPERCIPREHCGTVMPVWLNGTHPTKSEGSVSRDACANSHGGGGTPCCEHKVSVGVKNCGDFYVYYLFPTASCPTSYCAGDKLTCPPGKNSTTGFAPCEDIYPEDFEDALPSLSGPEIHGRSFRFNCDVNYTGSHHDPDLTYEVQWTFDGQADPNVPNVILADPDQRASLPGSVLKGHLGTNVGCRVKAWYRNRTIDQRSPWRDSNTYWAGIRMTPKVEITEKGGNRTVTVTSTIPIVCDHRHDSACCLHLALDTDGPQNNAVMPHPCHYTLCKADWNPGTQTASTSITLVATKDQIRDGTQNLLLSFDTLRPGGGGPYLDVFSGYRINASQVTVKDAQTHMCSWVTDPHFHTFNHRAFDMLIPGDFTIYENTQDSFEVQARTFNCHGRAACTCALAIREHSDVIRVNNCPNIRAAPRVDVARHPLRDGTVIRRSRGGHHLVIYLPSGREVKVDALGYCLNTVLSVPGSDEGHGRGLCGTLDGHRHTDFTHRDGQVDRDSCDAHFRGCHPTHFIQSWRNHGSTSLFESVPNDVNNHKEDPKYCQCDRGVHGSARINCTTAADVAHRAQQCGSSHCHDVTNNVPQFLQGAGHWTRREAVYEDLDEADPPVHLPTGSTPHVTLNVTWPTASGIREAEAERRCQGAIQASQLYPHCTQETAGLAFTVDSCVLDVLYGDNFDMVDAAVAAFTAHCQFQLRQDPQNYDVNPDGTRVMKAQFADVCSITCLRHGRCDQGACVCDSGYTGDDCQLVAGQAPVLANVRGSPFCDLNQRPCRTIYFDASHFQMGDDFRCRVQAVEADGSMSGPVTEDKAKFISGDRLACSLPDATDRSVTNFSVSVTNDGSHYSDSKPVVVYDSSCQTCDEKGCVQKSDTCLIDHLCHQNGDHKTDDEAKMCNTSASTVQWTAASLGQFPKISPPALSGPDDNFMVSCAIPTASRAPSARYRVTWYADDKTIGQETVDSGTRVAYFSVFDLPVGRLDLQCKVKSFYAGQDVFSPELASAVLPWLSAK